MTKKFSKKTIFNFLVIAFSVSILIYFCISQNGLFDLLKSSKEFDKFWLFLAVIVHIMNIFLDAYLIFRFTNTSKVSYSFKNAFKCCMVGQFFSAITPGASGGQPMQVYAMKNQKLDTGHATSALMQKFFVYQSTMIIYTALALFFKSNLFKNNIFSVMRGLLIFGFISQGAVIFLILLFSFKKNLVYSITSFFLNLLSRINIVKDVEIKNENIKTQLEFFHKNNSNLYRKPLLLIESYIVTTIQITCMFVVPYCIYRSFHLNSANVFDMIASQSFVSLVSSFIPLPGGSGAAEGGFLVFFTLFFNEQNIKSAVLLWRAITYFLTILISFPFSKIEKNENLTKETINESVEGNQHSNANI